MDYFSAISTLEAPQAGPPSPSALAQALRTSWDARTAYQGRFDPANPAAGQCYPTARVVQWFYPDFAVVQGEVCTGSGTERHFWNVRNEVERLDLSWEQFPAGSTILQFELLRSGASADSTGTQARCLLLLERVIGQLRQR